MPGPTYGVHSGMRNIIFGDFHAKSMRDQDIRISSHYCQWDIRCQT
jgi:prepilin-type processing-associated H-X9-DG protein